MSAIIRKPNGTVVVTLRLTLKPGRDDALIELVNLASQRRRGLSPAIREALRTGVKSFAPEENQAGPDVSGLGFEI